MSDKELQSLRRAAASGDLVDLSRLDAAECRVLGHSWKQLGHLNKWLNVKLCSRCLTVEGDRVATGQSPAEFAVFSRFNFNKRSRISHLLTDYTLNNYRSLEKALVLCGTVISKFADRKTILASSYDEISCKKCLRAKENLTPVNRQVNAKISKKLFNSLQIERPAAKIKSTSYRSK